jgi:hypothetical protein
VILNAAGMVSLDALRWCHALGVGVLVLASDGTAQLASTPRMTDDARLRRTQALSPFEPYGSSKPRLLVKVPSGRRSQSPAQASGKSLL